MTFGGAKSAQINVQESTSVAHFKLLDDEDG
jgi:hypothetical protein